MAAIDWSENFEKYKGLWVAMKRDQKTVVASGETAKEVLQEARKKGLPSPILFRVPTEIVPYIGGAF
ncbi:MAG: DUF5678 domain-containing protein [Patescibacteria group bacterium]